MSPRIPTSRRFGARAAACVGILLALAAPVHAGNGQITDEGDHNTVDLTINFRYPPGQAVENQIRNAVTGSARLLCGATDGQLIVDRVVLTEGQVDEDSADVWVLSETGRSRGGSTLIEDSGVAVDIAPGLGQSDTRILWKNGNYDAAVLAHELGHYIFGLGEQYYEERDDPFTGDDCGMGPGFELSFVPDGDIFDAANNSIMGSGILRCLDAAQPNQSCSTETDSACVVCSVQDDCGAGRVCRAIGSALSADGNWKVVGAYSEFSVPANHDVRRGTNNTCPMGCTPVSNAQCEGSYDHNTSRFEETQQTAAHDESDWETIERKYPGLFEIPAGLPVAGPASCDTLEVDFEDNLGEVDQVLLVFDRSHSMASSVKAGVAEVCDNDKDDDGDGTEDESSCAQSRIDFARAAGRAFLDVQQNSGIQVGIVTFSAAVGVPLIPEDLDPGNLAAMGLVIDGITTGGNTAIGEGLAVARDLFLATLEEGKSQTAIVLSDGRNNSGADPITTAHSFVDQIADAGGSGRIFTIPVSDSADEALMADLAEVGNASMMVAPTGSELTALYAELAVKYGGGALVLPRTDGQVAVNTSATYQISVEIGAESLTIFIAGRNDDMATWNVNYLLEGPGGSATIEQSACKGVVDDYFCRYATADPTPGVWELTITRAASAGAATQHFTVLAAVDNPSPDCFVEASPLRVKEDEPVQISGSAAFLTSLDEGVTLTGQVLRPDGSSVPFTLPHHAAFSSAGIRWEDQVGRGAYEVRLACAVPPGTEVARGESIFAGPDRPDIDVNGFVRHATQTFFVDAEDFPPCQQSDCDGDLLPNPIDTCTADTDGDGRPDCRDGDADGDEIGDTVEGALDTDNDGMPDFLDTDSDGDGILDTFDAKPKAKAVCDCGAPGAILGTAAGEAINGTLGNDIICSLGGNDTIHGRGGNDCIDGGKGDDELWGEQGHDLLIGGDGADTLKGGLGQDQLLGGAGVDTLLGEGSDDHLFGQAGADQLDGGLGIDLADGGSEPDVCVNSETTLGCP